MAFDFSLKIQQRLNEKLNELYGEFYLLRARIHGGETHLLDEAADAVERLYKSAFQEAASMIPAEDQSGNAIADLARNDRQFETRIKQLALEAVMSEPLATHVNILPNGFQPVVSGEREPYSFACENGCIHAVVLEHLAHATNEIFPLMIDAYVNSFNPLAAQHWNVIGLHVDWLNQNMQAQRAFFYHADSETLVEMNFEEPVNIDRIHSLCMTPTVHERISAQAGENVIQEINPYPAAQTADDKFHCYQLWNEQNLYTPPAALIQQDSFEDSRSLLKSIQTEFETYFSNSVEETVYLMLQPNRGTEGRMARAFYGSPEWEEFYQQNQELLLHARQILDHDDMIVRKGIGNVLWYDAEKQSSEYFDIRINVVDGKAESGYLMVAEKNSFVSSPGQQGRVVEWKSEEWCLHTPAGILSFSLHGVEWVSIQQAAEIAANCFHPCRLVGVDIRLEWHDSQLKPWILDINPRPAGLAHSRLFQTFEPGVTLRLWN